MRGPCNGKPHITKGAKQDTKWTWLKRSCRDGKQESYVKLTTSRFLFPLCRQFLSFNHVPIISYVGIYNICIDTGSGFFFTKSEVYKKKMQLSLSAVSSYKYCGQVTRLVVIHQVAHLHIHYRSTMKYTRVYTQVLTYIISEMNRFSPFYVSHERSIISLALHHHQLPLN
jgi:hypothetical protein